MKSDNSAYLLHILDAINKIQDYFARSSNQEFIENEWDQAAVIRYLEIIGEAASNLSDDFKNIHREIPWRKISDFRNVLTHEYFGVDLDLVWEIIKKDVPQLKKYLDKILKK